MAAIWIVVNFPPPVHGAAAFHTTRLGELANRGIDCCTLLAKCTDDVVRALLA